MICPLCITQPEMVEIKVNVFSCPVCDFQQTSRVPNDPNDPKYWDFWHQVRELTCPD